MTYKFNRGSEWHKWDLHIHTPLSIIQSYGADQWEEYINALENLPANVKVVGITDYYFVDGFERIMEYRSQGRLKNLDKIFPILEFRTNTFGSSSENKLTKINLHILFDIDEANYRKEIAEIKNEFIGQIHLTELDEHKTTLLSKENLSKEANNDLHNGFESLIPSTKEVFSIINAPKWKDRIFLFLGYREWSNLDKNNQLKPFKKDLYNKVSAFLTANSRTLVNSKKWLDEYGSKPLLHSLDIHNFNSLPPNDYYCHTWIKGMPSFEGLKQLKYEASRVKIQEEHPNNERAKYNIIDKIRFIDNSGEKRFTDFEIGLSPHLNAVIGGKSSGKSLLMHLLAKSLGNTTDSKDYDKLTKDISLEVYYADNPNVARDKDDKRIVEFLPQLHIENIVSKRNESNNHEEFNNFIERILKQNSEVKNVYKNKIEKIKDLKISLTTDITKWIQEDLSYRTLRDELTPLGDKSIILAGIKSIEDEIEQLKKDSGLEPEDIKEFNLLSNKKQRAESIKTSIEKELTELELLKNYLEKQVIQSIGEEVKFETDSQYANNLFKIAKSDIITQINKIIVERSIPRIDSQISDLSNRITRLDGFIIKYKEKLKPYLDGAKIEEKINLLNNRKKTENNKIKIIEEKEKEVEDAKKKRDRTDLIQNYSDIKLEYNTLVSFINNDVSTKWDEGTSGLTLEASVKFNDKDFSSRVQSIVNIKSSLQKQFGGLLFDGHDFNYSESDHISMIKSFFESVICDNERFNNFKAGNKLQQLLEVMFEDFFFIDYDIKKGTDSIRGMSEGKKGIVILQLYLSLSNAECPILIDQPEDNLDNRTVYQELNDYIKKAKLKRQIIMVSHNANLVVNTDAENIIVANQMGEDGKENRKYKFEYVNGSLENTFEVPSEKGVLYQKGIKEHICEILEGGKEAFINREQKYDLKRTRK